MNTTIKVTYRTTYGQERYDPDNDLAKALTLLAGQTTLTRDQLKLLDKAGFEIEIVQRPVTLKD